MAEDVLALWASPSEDADSVATIVGGLWAGAVCVAADCAIENEAELRADLDLRAGSVNELIVRAYATWGEGFVARLRGEFALVLWDSKIRKLLAARDPFGIRPLFYSLSGGDVRFAYSIEPLMDRRRSFDDQMIVEYLLGKYDTAGATFFRNVRELPGGSVLVVDTQTKRFSRPWVPEVEPIQCDLSVGEYQEELLRLFVRSVKNKLRSTSPVMTHVSGGLDSSCIVGAVDFLCRREELPTPCVRGVAALHPGLACDESSFIDAVADAISFPVERWDATAVNPADPDLVDPAIVRPGIRAPFRSGSAGDVSIAGKHGGAIILAGVGGDEIGMPFGFIKDLIRTRQWSRAVIELLFFPGASNAARWSRLLQVARQSVPNWALRFRTANRVRPPFWLHSRMRPLAESTPPRMSGTEHLSYLARNVWRRVTSVRLGRAVTQLQEHASLHHMSYRFPFLDRDLVSFVLRLPVQAWPAPRPFARLHREALSPLLPPQILGRFGKAEFTPALAGRIRAAAPVIQDLLERGVWCSENYVRRDDARRLCRGVLWGQGPKSSEDWLAVWSVSTLEAWMRRVLGYS